MESNLFSTNFKLSTECDEFLVISGSIVHIQKFIYDTTSQGALKNLRGRSFFLTLLTRGICEKLLYELDVPQRSVLYNSGGTFCIVAPKTDKVKAKIDATIKSVKLAVANMLHSDVVNISYVYATFEALNNDCIDIFAKLFEKKHQSKFMPYGADADYDSLFRVDNVKQHKSYEQIGAQLYNITGIMVCREQLSIRNTLCVDMHELGVYFYLGKASEMASSKMNGSDYLLLINDEVEPKNCTMPIYREYIAGNGTRANSFEDLFSNNDSSHRRLVVLRMDVDNLGLLLQSKMHQHNPLSEYALFSHRLDKYFKEHINEMWKQKYSDSTVVIYAGGDDLFIVGEWENALKFTSEIEQNFRSFFRNESIGISGGISLVEPKYPIIRAAEMSAEEESLAKGFSFNGEQKNAISIFGMPLRWQHEFKWVNDYKDHLCRLIEDGYIDKSIISHIQQIGENVTFEDGKVNPIRYIWLAAYDLSRMAKSKGDIGKGFIKQCILDIMSGRTLDGKQINSPYHALQLIIIAARLAEMTQWKTN